MRKHKTFSLRVQLTLWMASVFVCGSFVARGFSIHSIRKRPIFRARSHIPFIFSATRGGHSDSAVRTSYTTAIRGANSDDAYYNNSTQDNSGNNGKLLGIPATAWNHKTPTAHSTELANHSQSKIDARTTRDTQLQEHKVEPRTGWLHNTSPKQSANLVHRGGITVETSKARLRLQQAMVQQERNHRIISPPAFHACGDDCQIVVTEHRLSVPVVYPDQNNHTKQGLHSSRIDLHFTIVEKVPDLDTADWFTSLTSMTPTHRAQAYIAKAGMMNANDMLLYLQGGPGFGAPAPVSGLAFSKDSSWGAAALTKYKRIVLMDQRGTGMSSPITKQSLEQIFPDLFVLDYIQYNNNYNNNDDDDDDNTKATTLEVLLKSLETLAPPTEYEKFQVALQQAVDYLAQFRADNIVRDAEYIKEALMIPLSNDTNDDDGPRDPNPWGAALGQSFGGFCIMTYLSLISHPPRICLLTGGIAPMLSPTYEVYSKLWDRVKERSLRYYEMYPGDIETVQRIVRTLLQKPERLPSGGTLTARRFLQHGMILGGGPSSFASMHNLVQSAFLQQSHVHGGGGNNNNNKSHDHVDVESNLPVLNRAFIKYFDSAQPFDDHPLYYWLHESIYANGPEYSPTNWSAHAAYQDKIKKKNTTTMMKEEERELKNNDSSEWDYHITSRPTNQQQQPTLFFGEMIFPWMADDYAECGGIGCTALVHALANKTDWDSLYHIQHMRRVLGNDMDSTTNANTNTTANTTSHDKKYIPPICRAAAAVYYNDMYVDFDCAMKVVASGGPLEKCQVYVTNEYQHSGLRDDGAKLFYKLHGMATGSVRTPS